MLNRASSYLKRSKESTNFMRSEQIAARRQTQSELLRLQYIRLNKKKKEKMAKKK